MTPSFRKRIRNVKACDRCIKGPEKGVWWSHYREDWWRPTPFAVDNMRDCDDCCDRILLATRLASPIECLVKKDEEGE